MSNSVHICTAGCQHFCRPSDLLSTTTTCFSQLNAYIFLCSSCGQNLIQFATPCRPSASTVCLTCTSVLQNSWQNNYVRIGPVSDAVLTAIVFVSMIANRPMEMAIIVSDPQKKRGTRSTDLDSRRDRFVCRKPSSQRYSLRDVLYRSLEFATPGAAGKL
jgi:hypothetical protein